MGYCYYSGIACDGRRSSCDEEESGESLLSVKRRNTECFYWRKNKEVIYFEG